jgi:hypothetical protein
MLSNEQAMLAAEPGTARPAKVELRQTDGRYQLFVNQKPFYVKGAGIEFGSPEKLREHGGNSFRTWRVDNGRDSGQAVLDRAWTNGLYVTMGLDLARERHGFDYNDPQAVARQLARVKADILKYKDHPAMLVWSIGNELNLNASNPKVWDAVNEISKVIHQLDTNHLTTTALSGFGKDLVAEVRRRAPDLDYLSFQMYGDVVNLPRYMREAGWNQPYMVTEWGTTGHWECGKTAWNAPIETDSTTKANLYRTRFEKVIKPDQKLCLGSYVFLWGQKQERTPTWYGMFLESGEETASVDALHFEWNGAWPANQSPKMEGCWLAGKTATQNVELQAGQTCTARVRVSDPDRDSLSYRWEIWEESTEKKVGGDTEDKPKALPGLIAMPQSAETTMQAPAKPGAYRLFAYAFDGHGHAAHANIPFFVSLPPAAKTAGL